MDWLTIAAIVLPAVTLFSGLMFWAQRETRNEERSQRKFKIAELEMWFDRTYYPNEPTQRSRRGEAR